MHHSLQHTAPQHSSTTAQKVWQGTVIKAARAAVKHRARDITPCLKPTIAYDTMILLHRVLLGQLRQLPQQLGQLWVE